MNSIADDSSRLEPPDLAATETSAPKGTVLQGIRSALEAFDRYTTSSDHLNLEIQVPIGFFRYAEPPIKDAHRWVCFVMTYDGKLLEGAFPIGESSGSAEAVRISCVDQERYAFRFEDPPALCVKDARRLVAFLLHYFHGFGISLATTNLSATGSTSMTRF
jgi:hypothetical protein